MSESMVERVARACWQTQTIRPWEDAHETEREEMIGYARAAIEAMRTPTDAMVAAGSRSRPYCEDDGYHDGPEYRANTEGTWGTMIDAALNEHENTR